MSEAAGWLLETNDTAVLDMFADQNLVPTPTVQELLRERAPVLLQIAFIEGVLLNGSVSACAWVPCVRLSHSGSGAGRHQLGLVAA